MYYIYIYIYIFFFFFFFFFLLLFAPITARTIIFIIIIIISTTPVLIPVLSPFLFLLWITTAKQQLDLFITPISGRFIYRQVA